MVEWIDDSSLKVTLSINLMFVQGYVLHAERSRKIINRTLNNNRIGSASKRSTDLAN